ncbi:unnamed protein product [Nesidiocoris tenuis]|uniref:aralkylamine N-acetyltransferase n=1 Tax=Nesidiocoris tenuis TaxID=355587 RepID=A0A6H5G5G4_9HEMI|nr:unnamed protein product [Nesidiocoris tenuis]
MHMRHNFFADEPTTLMLGIGRHNEPVPMFEDLFVQALKEELSVMYLHTATNQIGALSINGIFKPSDIHGGRESAVSEAEIADNVLMIYNLFTEIHRCLNLFEKYDVDNMFDIKAISVDKSHRKKGLAKALISASLDVAECCRMKVVKTEGTSAYSQKAFQDAGFKTVWERNYSAFLCENGDPVFMPVDPHVSLKIMTKILSE